MRKMSDLGARIDQLAASLPGLLGQLATRDDEQIIRIAADARRLERFAFLLRGMCASVLRQRCQHWLPGGRGKRDSDGVGIQAQMATLAEQAGVDRRTLEVDARISDTFFANADETTLEHIPPLAREYYVIALSAPDPHVAIKEAAARCSDTRYGLRQFRTDVQLSKRVAGSLAMPSVPEHARACRVRIPAEVNELMAELVAMSQKTEDEIVAEAIRTLHAALTKRAARKRRNADSQRTPAQALIDGQLELML